MSWAKPNRSKNELYRTGKLIAAQDTAQADDYARRTVEHWRLCHALPLKMVGSAIEKDAKAISHNVLVTRRLKRFEAISQKLMRGDVRDLSNMQDIAGCRVVVDTIDEIRSVLGVFSGRQCKLHHSKDYINTPRSTGYRGVHAIVEYAGRSRHEHDGLRVEIQLRTRLQHRWATAVETLTFVAGVGDLKSGRGNPNWLEFLSVMSDAYSIADSAGMVKGYDVKVDDALQSRMHELYERAGVNLALVGLQAVSDMTSGRADIPGYPTDYGVFVISRSQSDVGVAPFRFDDLSSAHEWYVSEERRGSNAVLVFADDIKSVVQGYPSYFTDMALFRRDALNKSDGGRFEA